MQRGGAGFVAAVFISAVTTVGLFAYPQLRFAVSGPQLRGAYEMAASVIASFVAILAVARLSRRRGLPDLTLAGGLIVSAAANLLFALSPGALGLPDDATVTWLVILGRLAGSVLFGAAAFVPGRSLRHPGRTPALLGAGLSVILLGAWVLARSLPPLVVVAPGARPAHVVHTTALFSVELVAAVVNALAAAGYLRRTRRTGDDFLGWLALAAVLSAAAHANYAVDPALYGDAIAAGDVFRTACYLVLFTASVWEIRSYWMELSELRVARERRRIARDLHDGLAQELTYLTRHLESLEGAVLTGQLDRLRAATERAQLESRLAVTRLTAATAAPVGEALAHAVGEAAKRFGLDLELDLDPGLRVSPARTDTLVRIACEAIVNAARHSGAGLVAVTLAQDGAQIRMAVSDQGRGFDPATVHPGFGLISMRERAEAIGADLVVTSAAGWGSRIEVVL